MGATNDLARRNKKTQAPLRSSRSRFARLTSRQAELDQSESLHPHQISCSPSMSRKSSGLRVQSRASRAIAVAAIARSISRPRAR